MGASGPVHCYAEQVREPGRFCSRREPDHLYLVLLEPWLFGGWAEELRGLGAPREHSNIDLLYPGRDFERLDEFFRLSVAEERPDRSHPCSRSVTFEGVGIDLLDDRQGAVRVGA